MCVGLDGGTEILSSVLRDHGLITRQKHTCSYKAYLLNESSGSPESAWKHETPEMFVPDDEKNTIAFKESVAIPFVLNGGFLGLPALHVLYLLFNKAPFNILEFLLEGVEERKLGTFVNCL